VATDDAALGVMVDTRGVCQKVLIDHHLRSNRAVHHYFTFDFFTMQVLYLGPGSAFHAVRGMFPVLAFAGAFRQGHVVVAAHTLAGGDGLLLEEIEDLGDHAAIAPVGIGVTGHDVVGR